MHHIINNVAGALYNSSIKHKTRIKIHTKGIQVEHYSGGNERENSVVLRRLQKTDNDGECLTADGMSVPSCSRRYRKCTITKC